MKSKDKSVDEKEVLESDEAVDLSPDEQVEALKLEIEKHNEQLMRVAADFDNFRKRVDTKKTISFIQWSITFYIRSKI